MATLVTLCRADGTSPVESIYLGCGMAESWVSLLTYKYEIRKLQILRITRMYWKIPGAAPSIDAPARGGDRKRQRRSASSGSTGSRRTLSACGRTRHAIRYGHSGELDIPLAEAGGRLSAAVGTAELVTSSPPGATPEKQTVTVLSFADPEHPSVVRQFSGVTAMVNDDARGLIYLADSGGLRVLRAEPATDVELEREYVEYVLYDH